MNIRNFFFSHQTAAPAPVVDAAPVPSEIIESPDAYERVDFTLADADSMTLRELFDALRKQTVHVSEEKGWAWTITEYVYRGAFIRVKLTEDQDIVYSVNHQPAFNLRDAIHLLKYEMQF